MNPVPQLSVKYSESLKLYMSGFWARSTIFFKILNKLFLLNNLCFVYNNPGTLFMLVDTSLLNPKY